jgi:hypothetical protein
VRETLEDGTLRYPLFAEFRDFVSRFRDRAPNVAPIAWVSVTNRAGGGKVDLSRAEVRGALTDTALTLVRDCGFVGVQWDYEACASGDAGFLKLLQESQRRLPREAILGVAAPIWAPWFLPWSGWDSDYFSKVAESCDQIAVMGYDTGAYFPRLYVWLMAKQAVEVSRAVTAGNPKCRVLIGVPSYGTGLASHNPRAENIGLALRGVRKGLASVETRREALSGVAVFADYTTSRDEWLTYERLWLGEPAR